MPRTATRKSLKIAVSDEVAALLVAAGKSVSDVLLADGSGVDASLLEELRDLVGPADVDVDALGSPALEAVVDAVLTDEELDVVTDDERELADFNFDGLVATLDLVDLDGSLAVIEEERGAFVAAARRAGKKNGPAEFFNVVNGPLFNRRTAFMNEVVELDAVPEDERDIHWKIASRRSRRMLECLTEIIVRFNYGMTRRYVRLFTSNTSREDSDDFQGAAILGLMNSIDTFDPAKGRFGSWAYKRIQREVLRAVRDADFANMNHGDFERRPDILRAKTLLAGDERNPRNPSFPEIAAQAGVTVELVARVLNAPYLESLHTHVGDEGDTELGDLIPDRGEAVDSQVMGSMDVETLLRYGMPALDTRENFVLVRRYGLDGEPAQCLSSIGRQLCLSREAVRQIESKGLAKILHPITLRKLVRNGR